MTRSASRDAGFTLVEVMIALAIMAVGVTAVIGVFVMATATHKRAIDETTAALIAQAAAADARGALTATFDARALFVQRAGTQDAPPVLLLRRAATLPDYPGYAYDTLLTPVDDPDPDRADLFHVEVRVRWLARGKESETTFHTAAVRTVTWRDIAE